uniref:Uncharacterized protein n=1 Tax=Salix viminalis TaxID=40686 RepID=A0A6N2LYY6_SALVM
MQQSLRKHIKKLSEGDALFDSATNNAAIRTFIYVLGVNRRLEIQQFRYESNRKLNQTNTDYKMSYTLSYQEKTLSSFLAKILVA